jgi:hypothetical protein
MPAVSNFISQAWRGYRRRKGFAREILVLAAALVFGLVILPLAIWAGGRLVLGEYVRDPLTGATGGPLALWIDYLQALAHGSPGYWLACGGLYVIYLAVRLSRRLLKV